MLKHLMMTVVLLGLIVSCSGMEMVQTSPEVVDPTPQAPPLQGGIVVDGIMRTPLAYLNMVITLRGHYHGWRGKCYGPPPISKSDWMLDDGTGCIFVSGKSPKLVDPAFPKGELVYVTGKVKLSPERQPYIEAIKVDVFRGPSM